MSSCLPMKTTEKPDLPGTRHCSYCLEESPGLKICQGCKKRAYCSVACQKNDWSPSGRGQGHKNWCKVSCCEEDVDWKIEEIPGKCVGLIALKYIPALTRVLVDRVYCWEEAKDDQSFEDQQMHFDVPLGHN